jgi:peptidase A4-like protein
MRRVIAPLAALAALAAAAPASAATSTNWAGYAVTKSGTRFKKVTGTWIQPAVDCSSGRSYSAYWVGLGGYHADSNALEQIGTEADCSAGGGVHYEAWYELVPSTAVTLKNLTIRPGDHVSASVTVAGRTVRMRIADETTGNAVVKTLVAKAVDTRSAEWIVEAPALCDGFGRCDVQRLANFGTTPFSRVKATTATGHTGTLTDPAWTRTPISLNSDTAGGGYGPGRFIRETTSASATPGNLDATGSAFSVTYG